MKRFLSLMLVLAMSLTLFGAVAIAEEKEPVTLRFSWWGGDERTAATLEVINQFQELYPYITIEAEYGSSDGYHDKLATQLASGTAPDIIQIDPETLPTYVAAETEHFLNYDEYGFDFSKFEDSFLRQRINGYYDGKQYGIPTGIAGPALVVNQEMAEKFGIDLNQPYTWEDVIEYGKAVREQDSESYFLTANISYLTNLVFFTYGKQLCGDSLFNVETKELNISQEEMQQVFEYIKALYDNEVVPPASNMSPYENDNLQSDPNWIDGKYVASFAYVSTMNVLTAANENATYYAGQLPVLADAKNGGWAANCPQVMCIAATSQHPEEAMMFMDYFFNDPTAMQTLGTTRSVPPTSEARAICEENGLMTPMLAQAGEIAGSYGGTVNDQLISTAEAKQIIFDAVEQVAFGVVTPEQAAEETIAFLLAYVE